MAAHSLAELYAVLSTLPVSPRIGPSAARRLVEQNVGKAANIVTLSARDYRQVVTQLAERGLTGGVIYDALIARAAEKKDVHRLLTLNPHDFSRAWPAVAQRVAAP